MSKFLSWLAASPLASALKVAAAAFAVYLLDNLAGFGLAPAVEAVATAVLVVVVNWINPADGRYGNGSEG